MSINNFIYPNWNVPTNVKSLVTTRHGGLSASPYDTFNLAAHVGDYPDIVAKNRQILAKYLPGEPYWLNQTHSDQIICLNNSIRKTLLLECFDASYTYQKNIVCAVMSADCIPILLTDKNGSFAAAIHAGWRGVENNIIRKTINIIGVQSNDILVYMSAAICKNHFEVGAEIFTMFMQQDINNKSFFTAIGNGKFYCDLTAIAKMQLLKLGIINQNIYLSNMCTYCNKELFYSYRRDGMTGRIASMIWLE